jgi:hypothetical protein
MELAYHVPRGAYMPESVGPLWGHVPKMTPGWWEVHTGQVEAGIERIRIELLEDAIAVVEEYEDRCHESEVFRVLGDLHSASPRYGPGEALRGVGFSRSEL